VEHYVGIDVSLELSSVCVVDGRGKIVKEAKVASEPEAHVCFFKELGVPVNRIGLEAGPLSQWLHVGLTQPGSEASAALATRSASLLRFSGLMRGYYIGAQISRGKVAAWAFVCSRCSSW
jgi:hypothetical protein